MDGKKLEKIMMDFINHEYDVLLATTIIESGIDISNANTIIINKANNFGLSDLHQLRGRVGRSTRSEEHTSELQSRPHLVCRLLLEKKKKKKINNKQKKTTQYIH